MSKPLPATRAGDRPAPVTFADVRDAAERIADHVVHTHSEHSQTISLIAGAETVLKFENLQFTASFKDRGAANKLLCLTDAEAARGVVAASAGNHAQAVAHHGRRLGIATTIVMPDSAPFSKVSQTEHLGATVVIAGESVAESTMVARDIAERDGLAFVHPYDDPLVIAGQGTCGLELATDHPDLDAIIVPVGGGGLCAGVAVAACELLPGVEVYGVQSHAYPAMAAALAGEPMPTFGVETVADGIAVKYPGTITTPILAERLAGVIVVDEPTLEHAISLLVEVEKTVAEGSGAAGLAGLLARPDLFADKRVGVIVSGGNIDSRVLASVLLRELVRDGRMMVLGITVEDRPGHLAPILARIADLGANIVEVTHSRIFDPASVRQTFIAVQVETKDRTHSEAVVAGLAAAGVSVRRITPLRDS